MYAKIVDGAIERFPYTQSDLLQDHPNTSFPRNMSDAVLETHDMYKVRVLDKPTTYDPKTQEPTKNEMPEFVDGEWVLGWYLRQKTDEEIAEYLSRLSQQAYTLRDELLAASDWIVVVAYERSEPVPPEWSDYRQALRDVPQQAGFPEFIAWPERP